MFQPALASAFGTVAPLHPDPPAHSADESYLRIVATAQPGEGIVGRYLHGQATFIAEIRQAPRKPIAETFSEVEEELQAAINDQNVDLALLGRVTSSLVGDLPRAYLRAKIDFSLPGFDFLSATEQVDLYIFTPGWAHSEASAPNDPATGQRPSPEMAHAMVCGGVGFHGQFAFAFCGFSLHAEAHLLLEVLGSKPGEGPARLSGHFSDSGGATGQGFAELAGAFDTLPPPGKPWVTITGKVDLPGCSAGPWYADVLGIHQLIFPARPIGSAKASFSLQAGQDGFFGTFDAQADCNGVHLALPSIRLAAQPASTAQLIQSMTEAIAMAFFDHVKLEADFEARRLAHEALEAARVVKQALEDAKKAADDLKDEIDRVTGDADAALGQLKDVTNKVLRMLGQPTLP
jgi:hypothetical protein